tara:strand:- start:341 stop:1081 length:741 start_codon:yes stop_codon:yes gene_type:complete
LPNLPTHLFIAQAALNQITDDSIRKHESFYLLGSTAPDIKALSKTPREQSHFVKLNSFQHIGEGYKSLLEQNPYIKSVSGIHKAFWSGYISHLVLDETWIVNMYRNKFAYSIDETNHDYLQIMDRATQLHLDKIAYAHSQNWIKLLNEIECEIEIPFIQNANLIDWREFLTSHIDIGFNWERINFMAKRIAGGNKTHRAVHYADNFVKNMPDSINEIYKYVPEYQMRWFLHLGKQTVVKALNQYLK